jgi:hypothetical protein
MRQMMQFALCSLLLPFNLRQSPGDPEEQRRLGQSYLKRPIHPIICRTDQTVLDGSRRVLGMRLVLGDKSDHPVDCLVTDEALSPEEIIEINLITAMHRRDLTGWEKFQGCLKLKERHPEWSNKDLAACLNVDPSMITVLLSPERCLPAIKDALRSGAIRISDCVAMARVDEKTQHELLTARLTGSMTSRDQMHQLARKARKGNNQPTNRVNRIKCPLPGPGGRSVVVSGENLTLSDVIDTLQSVIKLARKADEEGIGAQVFERVCKDKAAKE